MTDLLSKEKRIIDRINSIYNKQQGDFSSLDEWNDYLEMKADIIFNLSEQVDVAETEKRIREYQRKNERDIMMRHAAQLQEAQEAAGVGPSAEAAKIDYSAMQNQGGVGAPPGAAFFDIDMEEPTAGPGVGMLAGPGSEMTREERIAKEQRAWKAGGWSDEIPKQRYITMLLTSLTV